MTDVLAALFAMGGVVALGWVVQARGLLPAGARETLAGLSFTVAAPCLLFVTLARTDLAAVVSRGAAVTWTTTAALALVLALLARFALRQTREVAAVTVLTGSYVNAGNLGIPLAVYLFDDALAVVPSLLFQLLVLAPVAFAVLGREPAPRSDPPPDDAARNRTTQLAPPPPDGAATYGVPSGGSGPSAGRVRRGGWWRASLRNPVVVGTLAGVAAAAVGGLTGHRLPEAALGPAALLGTAAPPLALLTFGMTLATGRARTAPATPSTAQPEARTAEPGHEPGARGERAAVGLAVAARAVAHPLLAWTGGTLAGLDGRTLAVVVTMAALPTAQNVVVYATRYRTAERLASRACLATTVLCVPVLLATGALLPGA